MPTLPPLPSVPTVPKVTLASNAKHSFHSYYPNYNSLSIPFLSPPPGLAARDILQFPSVPSNPRFGHPILPTSQPSLPNLVVPSAAPLPAASNVLGVPSIPTATAFPIVSNVPGVPFSPSYLHAAPSLT
ncbi:conserved hypothetical protein [Ricinus communis]|uniref:Uncharacterized protein n=1 Tax=Ricinus communis TaxID=3988 RepID=B9S9G2_RICCO|nr:conserved hypothetical protein [Ricinus communis]